MRGCLFAICLYAGLAVAYFLWLRGTFDPPATWIAAGIVAFLVFCCLGALITARTAARDWSLLATARHGLPFADGRLVAIVGKIYPVDQPVRAPFTGAPCALCEYEISRARHGSGDDDPASNAGVDYTGFLMNPCVIRSRHTEVKLLGFPELIGFVPVVAGSTQACRAARDFVRDTEFEDVSGFKIVKAVKALKEVWSDEDGSVRRNLRIRSAKSEPLFAPDFEQNLDRLPASGDVSQQQPAGSSVPQASGNQVLKDHSRRFDAEVEQELDDDLDDDVENDDDLDDADDGDGGELYSATMPTLSEKRVNVGDPVCAIGVYGSLQRGLGSYPGSRQTNRLMYGEAEVIEARLRKSVLGNAIGSIAALAVIHAAIVGVMAAYNHAPDVRAQRRNETFEAVRKGDLGQLERLLARGVDVNSRESGGRTLLLAAREPEVTAWLIGHGADVNAVSDDGETPLMQASRYGWSEIVEQLIKAGANLDLRSPSYNTTALMAADSAGHTEIAARLRQAGAFDDVVTAANGTPLPEDGGEPLAACIAYLRAIFASDATALAKLVSADSPANFAGVDWKLWQGVRPAQVTSFSGFVRDDRATLTLNGDSSTGLNTTWVYQLVREGGTWKVLRENWIVDAAAK